MSLRQPRQDEWTESPIDWQDVPLGAGQEPNNRSHLQYTTDIGELPGGQDVRREPGWEELPVVHRPPTWPA